jgi:tetratricopeptide (TPR) repeat protein
MKNTFICVLVILLAVLWISCNSDPEVTEDTPEDTQEPVKTEKPESEYNKAKALKELISKYSLNNYAESDFAEAEGHFTEAENNYEKDNDASKAAFYKAIAKYNVVVEMGFPLLIEDKKKAVDPVKEDSEELKAQNASTDNYQKALDTYNQALAEKEAGNYEKSVELMEEAKTLFDELYIEVVEKRDRAQASLNAFDQSIKNAEQRVLDDINNSQ